MSNILDALRKAQSEQNITTGKTVPATEPLLTQRTTGTQQNSHRRAILIGGCGLLMLAVVGWLLYTPSQKPVITQHASTTSAPPTAALPVSVSKPLAELTQMQVSQAVPLVSSTLKLPAKPVNNDNEADTETPRNLKHHRIQSQFAPPVAAVPNTVIIASAPEGIKLTGIAWQSSRKLRRAVINDVLVGEGAVLAGATIAEIKQNAVRFEKNGTLFETALLK
jgi:general secretion pathway protein B